MPQIGWFEILIIVAISIVVIGPKDFPLMLRKIGSWVGAVKRYIGDFQKEISDIEEENTISNLEQNNLKKKENDQK